MVVQDPSQITRRAAYLLAIDEDYPGKEKDMSFFARLLAGSKSDRFGIDSAIEGRRQLQQRIQNEENRLQELNGDQRDQALADPAAEIDVTPILKQEKRIEILQAALEKATAEAASRLDRRIPEIESTIKTLNSEAASIRRQRDKELLRAIAAFLQATGAQVSELPKRGQGGFLLVPGAQEMSNTEIKEFFAGLSTEHEPTEAAEKLAEVSAKLNQLTMIRHFGAERGLSTLAG